MATAESVPARPATIEKLLEGVFPAIAMVAGIELDVFTQLKEGPLNALQVAGAIGVKEVKLRPLLYVLVMAGLLTMVNDLFCNTPEADYFLVRSSPGYMTGANERFRATLNNVIKTTESIRTGIPQAKIEFSKMSNNELESLFRGLHTAAVAAGWDLVRRYDFTTRRSLVDVGGGSGGLAIAMAEACPNLQLTVVDLPSVTTVAERFIKEAGLTHRVKVMATNVVNEPILDSYDVAVLREFVQVLSPEDARQALLNIGKAIKPGGVIYILGSGMLDDSHLSPPEAVIINMVFLNLFDAGQAYTEQEYRGWLDEAGFEAARIRGLLCKSSVSRT